MLCSAYPQVVGKVIGVVLWRLQFQLTRLVCGNSLLSRCGGSCFWMLGRVAYCTTSLRWRPGTVRGFDSLSIRAPWLAVKSHFLPLDFLMAVWVR